MSPQSQFRFLALLIGLSLLVGASDSHAQSRRARPGFWGQTKFATKLSVSPTYFPEDLGQETSQWSTPIRVEPEWSARPMRVWRLRLAPYFYSDPVSPSSTEPAILDLNEASLERRWGDWSFRIGANPISWGVTDVYNPLDVASSRRYMDPLSSEKRPVPSLILSRDTGNWRFDAFYSPVQLPSIMPGDKSRWLPRDIVYNRRVQGQQVTLARSFRYRHGDNEDADGALKNNFGFRIEKPGNGMDLTFIAHEGAPTAPAVLLDISGTLQNSTIVFDDLTLRPNYYRRRTAGLGVVWTLESTIIRFAAAYSDRLIQNPVYPGWAQSSVLGIEQNFPVGASTLTALLQATYARHEEQADNSVTSIERIFDQSWLLGLRMTTSSDWTFSLAGLYDGIAQGVFVQGKAERKITDGITASLEGSVIDGREGTALGTYRRNDRVSIGLTAFY